MCQPSGVAVPWCMGDIPPENCIIRAESRVLSTGCCTMTESEDSLDVSRGYLIAPYAAEVTWAGARASSSSGERVEVARLPRTDLAVIRNRRGPGGVWLTFPLEEITAFIAAAKNGEFDAFLDGASTSGGRAA